MPLLVTFFPPSNFPNFMLKNKAAYTFGHKFCFIILLLIRYNFTKAIFK